jgi:hypothetical protein
MTPSKPFLFCLAIAAAGAVTVLITPASRVAAAEQSLPLSTHLTPEMIDFFGLRVAYDRPSIAELVACGATSACGASDSSRIRFLDASGAVIPTYDRKAGTIIERVRREQTAPLAGVTEARTTLRAFTTDAQGRVVMNGTDSIVRVTRGDTPSTLVRVNHYSDVRYLVTDPRFPWPLTGLVVLELSNALGADAHTASHTASHTAVHAAATFDGTPFARIITTGALTHRANLQAQLFETTLPDR